MERGHDSRTSAAPGGISPCREYASAALGEGGGLCIYGAVRPTEDHAILVLTCIMTRMYRRSGHWAPERGIFWEIDSATEDSSESDEFTDRSDSDEPEEW